MPTAAKGKGAVKPPAKGQAKAVKPPAGKAVETKATPAHGKQATATKAPAAKVAAAKAPVAKAPVAKTPAPPPPASPPRPIAAKAAAQHSPAKTEARPPVEPPTPAPARRTLPPTGTAPSGFAETQANAPLSMTDTTTPAAAPTDQAPELAGNIVIPGPHLPGGMPGGGRPPISGMPKPPPKPLGNNGKDFKAGDHVVYPTHGVGQVQGIEELPVMGSTIRMIVVTFDENRMTLKVPIGKAASSGLRMLADGPKIGEALDTLKGRARIKRTMWSRRAQEYEQKINSGDPIAIAEVVRDLHRNAGQPDQSFSERQIYEQALDRLAAEVAAIDRTDKPTAVDKLLATLKSGLAAA
ncbi:CarD family transcriptional regulator [Humitalea sp. 24SJ18S-53]|uniref:CarD family transcriptional regulator n=1 Tax=Humitalea sp. 24SJ18S-53 TaxID=3422307 RepID=UPI003D67E55E